MFSAKCKVMVICLKSNFVNASDSVRGNDSVKGRTKRVTGDEQIWTLVLFSQIERQNTLRKTENTM